MGPIESAFSPDSDPDLEERMVMEAIFGAFEARAECFEAVNGLAASEVVDVSAIEQK